MFRKVKSVAAATILGVGMAGMAAVAGANDSVDASAPAETAIPMTIVDAALAANAKDGSFSYLLAAATCPQLDGAIVAALTGDGPLTLFAPTDAAFQKLQMTLGITAPAPGKTCDLDAETLAAVLTYHVTPGSRFVTGLGGIFNSYNPLNVAMLSGDAIVTNPNLTIHDANGQSVRLVPGAVNLRTGNGVIHAVDSVLLPF